MNYMKTSRENKRWFVFLSSLDKLFRHKTLFVMLLLFSTVQLSAESNMHKLLTINESDITENNLFNENDDDSHLEQPQQRKIISGKVFDSNGEPIPGATVVIKGTRSGVATDVDGSFTLNIDEDAVLVITSVGFMPQELPVAGRSYLNVVMVSDEKLLEEVVVVGYAVQKKESVVGSVAKLDGEVLETRGGAVNISQALQGQIPGVVVIQGSGEPGRDDPEILIRGMSTWNNAEPLILVDGIERRMNDIKVKDVESVSVLKDASSTAVFGVKGANGVILITTKRGTLGKPVLTFNANTVVKTVSKLSLIMDAYEARKFKNEGIERELAVTDNTWQYYTPMHQLQFFKRPQEEPYNYLYPNVDWVDLITADYALSSQYGVDVRGGTDFVKYFVSLGYIHDGDMLNTTYQEDRGYRPEFSYDRFNFRNNLDFTLTPTTTLSANISGYLGRQQGNYVDQGQPASPGLNAPLYSTSIITGQLYWLAPDAFYHKYSDGFYGRGPDGQGGVNPLAALERGGIRTTNRTHLGTDIKLDQKLDFITEGLSVNLSVSWDGYSATNGPGISENSNAGRASYQYISPEILLAKTREDSLKAIQRYNSLNQTGINEFDYVLQPWQPVIENSLPDYLQRSLFYQAALNYNRAFDKHAVSALALFNRREDARGSVFANYREDWVGRITYNYDDKYFGEVNAAYNGSEKFGPEYRFGFFPSFAVGWTISNENFMQRLTWVDALKVRGSIGKIGSDAGIPRWAYMSSWNSGQNMIFQGEGIPTAVPSIYPGYFEGTIANPNIRWETAIKKNIGLEFAALNNSFTLELDLFWEDRKDIFMSSGQRSIPDYFGAPAIPANLGETFTKGYEITLGYRKANISGFGYSVLLSASKAVDKIVKMEDPQMMEAYMKREGFQIGQPKTAINAGYMNNWDDVYASTPSSTNMSWRMPGDWDMVDYNGDGSDTWDAVPWGFPVRPQYNFSALLRSNYKKLNVVLQFYGVTNTNLSLHAQQPEPTRHTAISAFINDYWTPDNLNADFRAPRVGTKTPLYNYTLYDGSYLRLQTAEIGYLLDGEWLKNVGVSALRLYMNGNNLFYWSHMPSDTERSFVSSEAYPRAKHYNLGVEITF